MNVFTKVCTAEIIVTEEKVPDQLLQQSLICEDECKIHPGVIVQCEWMYAFFNNSCKYEVYKMRELQWTTAPIILPPIIGVQWQ